MRIRSLSCKIKSVNVEAVPVYIYQFLVYLNKN